MMIEIFIIRHAKTEANGNNIIIGWNDSPILKSSIKNIKKIADKLNNYDFDLFFYSDIKRAKTTADLIYENLKHKPEFVEEILLREVDYGKLSGKSKDDTKKEFPEYHNVASFTNPDGESFNDMFNRISRFLDKILVDKNMNKKIIIVTHSGCIRAFYSYFKDEDMQKNINMKVKHTDVMKCTYDNDKKEVNFI